MTPHDQDRELIDACRRGDRRAMEAVFRAEAPGLTRLLARLVGRSADVEDLLQTTFLRAIRAFPGFRGEAAVGTWLAKIAVRAAREQLVGGDARRHVSLKLVTDDVGSGAASPDRVADERRSIARITAHLAGLDADKRIAFVLHVIEGKPIDEVAVLVGAGRLATKSRVFWARRLLLRRMRRDPALREWLDGKEVR